MLVADLTIAEVMEHRSRLCTSGHIAAKLFTRDPKKGPEPTRFFRVTKHDQDFGIYCEPCLIVAHYMARKKKEAKRNGAR